MLARDVMSSPVVTVRSWTPLAAATSLLVSNGFTAVPVIDDDDRLIGIITEADLLRDRVPPDPRRTGGNAPDDRGQRRPRTVGEVMSTPVESLTPGADIADAAHIMIDERIRCLPIVDGHHVVGIITRRDLLRVIGEPPAVRSRPVQPVPRASVLRDFDPDCP